MREGESRTVETCPHRHSAFQAGSSERARCRLMEHFLGGGCGGLGEVGRDACEACVESFAPTTDDINYVIASLLYNATETILRSGRSDLLDPAEARRLHEWAERSIPLMFPDEDDAPGAAATADRGSAWIDLGRVVPIPDRRCGPGVREWAVGVTTAPRRLATLEYCLDALIGAGWDEPTLFIDSAVDVPSRFSRLARTVHEPKLGAWPNYLLALTELTLRKPDADAYMIVQDDALLTPHPGLRAYVEGLLWPGDRPGVVTLYRAGGHAHDRPGWHASRDPWFWGALAFLFPNAVARQFLSDPEVIEHRRSGPEGGLAMIDVLVGRFAHRCGISVHSPTPSLVQHIGHVSTLWPTARASGFRRSQRFVGDIADPGPSPCVSRKARGIRFYRKLAEVVGEGTHRSGWPYAVRSLAPLAREDGVLLDDFVEQLFCYEPEQGEHRRPWVGIFHHPPSMPPFMKRNHAPEAMFQTEAWKRSRPNLLAAIALSDYLAHYLAESLGVPAFSVKHPSEAPPTSWDPARFEQNPCKRLIQVGWYLKNTQLVYQVPEPPGMGRIRLFNPEECVFEYDRKVARHWKDLGTRSRFAPGKVEELGRVSNGRYDGLLAENVVAIELFDASANNVVIECIARGTPIVVNRHPAVVEYLGDDYPLYFSDPAEVPDLLTTERVVQAHEHLTSLDRSWLDGGAFCESVGSILEAVERQP